MKMYAQCSPAATSDPFTQQDRCRSEADGEYNQSFQDRIEAINVQMGDSPDGLKAGGKQKFRSLFVNGMINGEGGFAITEKFTPSSLNPNDNRFSLSDEPGVIFAVDGDGDCVYERENEFLEWAVEQGFEELVLYNVAHLLGNGDKYIMSYPDPFGANQSKPLGSGINDNIMGEYEKIEWHLSRFIYKAKTDYELDVVAVISGSNTLDPSFGQEFYQFHIGAPLRSDDPVYYDDYLDLFEDFTEDYFMQYFEDFLDNPEDITYKTYGEDTLFLPRDDEDRISTIDKLVVDVYNLYVFQMRVSNNFIQAGGGDESLASCSSLPAAYSCLKAFDAHLWEWEWWDHVSSISGKDNGKQADFELKLLRLYHDFMQTRINNFNDLLFPDACPIADYVCFDRSDHHSWGNSEYTPSQRANFTDEMADRVYMYAYNNNPCDLYNSTQSSPGKTFHQKLQLFANNGFGGNNNSSVIVPVFNAKYHSNSHWTDDRPFYYGDGNVGCETNKPCDFCDNYSGNALNSLLPNYPKQMGFVENVFQDQYDLNPAKTSAQNTDNTILGYSWFKSSLLQENDVISGIEEPQEQTNNNIITIYPNPSSTGDFIIQSKDKTLSQIDVFTTTGQIVYSQKVNALQENIHIDTKGIYLVRVTTRDNQTETTKIVNQ